jgi:hypothetical protein
MEQWNYGLKNKPLTYIDKGYKNSSYSMISVLVFMETM